MASPPSDEQRPTDHAAEKQAEGRPGGSAPGDAETAKGQSSNDQSGEDQSGEGRSARDQSARDQSAETPLGKLEVSGVPRVISLVVLLAVVLLIGVLFFRVMASFLVPLFLAAVLAVVFKPLHQWSLRCTGGRPHRSALITTSIVSLAVLAPTVFLGWRAYVETSRIVRAVLADDEQSLATIGDDGVIVGELPSILAPTDPAAIVPPSAALAAGDESAELSKAEGKEVDEAEGGIEDAEAQWFGSLRDYAKAPLTWYRDNVDANFDANATLRAVARYTAQRAVGLGLIGIQALVGFAFGMAIVIFALYYFFADGPTIIETIMRLSPLDDAYEEELLVRFALVSRAVVLATILSAVVQGLLAGIGYYFVLEAGSPVFLLTVLTMLLAIVPFVGATAVWIPVAGYVLFVQDQLWPGVLFSLYGAGIVSTIDNILKPLVLHGQSNLHPLLALLSILGGIQLLGPVGILVGPMLVAFLQALLGMLRRELDSFQGREATAAG